MINTADCDARVQEFAAMSGLSADDVAHSYCTAHRSPTG